MIRLTVLRRGGLIVVRLVAVAGLGIDAGIHLKLAGTRPPGYAGHLSQVTLFNAEAAAAIVVALLVLVTGHRAAYLLGFLVAASALGAVLLYRYIDIGPLGPLPNMYEPAWYATKLAATVAEAIATLATAIGILRHRPHQPTR